MTGHARTKESHQLVTALGAIEVDGPLPALPKRCRGLLLMVRVDHKHEPYSTAVWPTYADPKEGSIMATEAVSTVTRPADVGLKREMGLIGAAWASETSIIGSGWLFAPLTAAVLIGGGAVLDWVIAGVVVIVLALCHAELGGMYPVSGGTARFPHFAFGSVAGIGFGFFSYVQAVTIAPIECFAFMQYASFYWHGLYHSDTKNVTGARFLLPIIRMAIFVAVNFLAMRIFARVNNTITWWKVAVPIVAII